MLLNPLCITGYSYRKGKMVKQRSENMRSYFLTEEGFFSGGHKNHQVLSRAVGHEWHRVSEQGVTFQHFWNTRTRVHQTKITDGFKQKGIILHLAHSSQ